MLASTVILAAMIGVDGSTQPQVASDVIALASWMDKQALQEILKWEGDANRPLENLFAASNATAFNNLLPIMVLKSDYFKQRDVYIRCIKIAAPRFFFRGSQHNYITNEIKPPIEDLLPIGKTDTDFRKAKFVVTLIGERFPIEPKDKPLFPEVVRYLSRVVVLGDQDSSKQATNQMLRLGADVLPILSAELLRSELKKPHVRRHVKWILVQLPSPTTRELIKTLKL